MDIVFGVITLFAVYLLVEAYFRRDDIRRFLLERIEAYSLFAFRFAVQRNTDFAENDRKTVLALSSQSVIDIAQRLSSVSLLRALADGCIDDDVRNDVLAIVETTKSRGRRAMTAKTRRTRRVERVQE